MLVMCALQFSLLADSDLLGTVSPQKMPQPAAKLFDLAARNGGRVEAAARRVAHILNQNQIGHCKDSARFDLDLDRLGSFDLWQVNPQFAVLQFS